MPVAVFAWRQKKTALKASALSWNNTQCRVLQDRSTGQRGGIKQTLSCGANDGLTLQRDVAWALNERKHNIYCADDVCYCLPRFIGRAVVSVTRYAVLDVSCSFHPPAHAGSLHTDFSTLKMEAICSSETSVHTRSTRRHIPEDGILHSHRRENLKS
jgi:hypothetical protein